MWFVSYIGPWAERKPFSCGLFVFEVTWWLGITDSKPSSDFEHKWFCMEKRPPVYHLAKTQCRDSYRISDVLTLHMKHTKTRTTIARPPHEPPSHPILHPRAGWLPLRPHSAVAWLAAGRLILFWLIVVVKTQFKFWISTPSYEKY